MIVFKSFMCSRIIRKKEKKYTVYLFSQFLTNLTQSVDHNTGQYFSTSHNFINRLGYLQTFLEAIQIRFFSNMYFFLIELSIKHKVTGNNKTSTCQSKTWPGNPFGIKCQAKMFFKNFDIPAIFFLFLFSHFQKCWPLPAISSQFLPYSAIFCSSSYFQPFLATSAISSKLSFISAILSHFQPINQFFFFFQLQPS